ncbi:glyoxalase [Verrucomicrobia bacterium LW23]|nr:glyoxalase [Verrucomicrobia bacterium LW23]
MSTTTSYIPKGYASVTPAITIRGAAKAIEFYKAVLGAKERERMTSDDGTVMHAELEIGDSVVMLSDEFPQWGYVSPQALGGTGSGLRVYVPDADAVLEKAKANGARVDRPMTNEFWGDRTGCFTDPFGHRWSVSTHVEDVSPEEMGRRARAFKEEFAAKEAAMAANA